MLSPRPGGRLNGDCSGASQQIPRSRWHLGRILADQRRWHRPRAGEHCRRLVGNNQVTVGSPYTIPLHARVLDAAGDPVDSGVSVTFTVTPLRLEAAFSSQRRAADECSDDHSNHAYPTHRIGA